jgi:hypothetical protein
LLCGLFVAGQTWPCDVTLTLVLMVLM